MKDSLETWNNGMLTFHHFSIVIINALASTSLWWWQPYHTMTSKEHINFHGFMPLLSTYQHFSILFTHEIYVTPPTITMWRCYFFPLLKKLNNYSWPQNCICYFSLCLFLAKAHMHTHLDCFSKTTKGIMGHLW